MDIHIVESDAFTVEDVVKAHMQDLAIQERFGVIQIKYWVNVEAKTLFCLMEGPSKDACNMVHKESHGNTACNIIEVSDDEFNLFLGENENGLALTYYGELDTGYRTILMLSTTDFTGHYSQHNNNVYKLIEAYQGVVMLHPKDEIMVSFLFASNAILCAAAIGRWLKSISTGPEFTLSVVSGRPVDKQGNNLFEETKKKVRCLFELGAPKTMYLDSDTKAISDKEHITSIIKTDEFKLILAKDAQFLMRLFDLLNERLSDPNFKTEDLNKLLGLSKSHTYRKIKLLTELAPNQLIQELRLRKSLKSLKQNDKTIAEIAYDFGFNSPAYYSKVFKTRFHLTPSCFTKLH